MTCNCRTFVRDAQVENKGQKLPMSKHHPNCNDYKLEAFAKVIHDGTSCIMEINEAVAMVFESEEVYEMCNFYLTRDQFERLPEFEGF